MGEDGQQKRCKYFNSGNCKYEDKYTLKKHTQTVCLHTWCQDKTDILRLVDSKNSAERRLAVITGI